MLVARIVIIIINGFNSSSRTSRNAHFKLDYSIRLRQTIQTIDARRTALQCSKWHLIVLSLMRVRVVLLLKRVNGQQ